MEIRMLDTTEDNYVPIDLLKLEFIKRLEIIQEKINNAIKSGLPTESWSREFEKYQPF